MRCALIVVLAIMLRAASADACSCVVGPDSCKFVGAADAVFEATVVSVDEETRLATEVPGAGFKLRERVVRLKDIRAIRGEAQDVVVTGVGGGDCGYPFRVGTRYLVVAGRSSWDGRLSTGICSPTQPLAQASGWVSYVESLSRPSTGGRIWGRVIVPPDWSEFRQRDSSPVKGARVSIRGPVERSIVAGDDGQFMFGDLPEGDYSLGAALPERPDLSEIQEQSLSVSGAHACATFDLVTGPRPGQVEGRVRDPSGRPLPGVFVQLSPVSRGTSDPLSGMGVDADGEGRYRFEKLRPGRYVAGVSIWLGPSPLSPFSVTYGHGSSGEVVIDVEPGEQVELQPMSLRRLSVVAVSGTLQAPDGTSPDGIRVSAAPLGERGPVWSGSPVNADAEGRFMLSLYAGARYRLLVHRGNSVEEYGDFVAGQEAVTITLRQR